MRYTQPQSGPRKLAPAFIPYAVWNAGTPSFDVSGRPTNELVNRSVSTGGRCAAPSNSFGCVGWPSLPGPGQDFTFFAVFDNSGAVPDSSALAGTKAAYNVAYGFHLEFNSSQNALLIFGASGTWYTASIPGIGSPGKIHSVAVRFKGTTVTVAYNGRLIGSGAITAAGAWTLPFALGNICDGAIASASLNTRIYAGGVLLGDPDILSLSANPWQLFKSPQRIMSASAATSIPLAADARGASVAASALSTSIPLDGSATGKNIASAALTTGVTLAANAVATNTAAAALTTGVTLAANARASDIAGAALGTAILLVSAAVATNVASAALTVGSVWASSAIGTNTASAAITTGVALSASAVATAAASATLVVGSVWTAGAVGASSASSVLTTGVALASAANARSTAGSDLTTPTSTAWAASAIATARASAALSTAITLQAIATARDSASSTLTIGTPPAFGPLSITRTMIITALRTFLSELAPGQRVIRTPVNRAAMPIGAFVAMTPGKTFPLATPTTTVDLLGGRTIKRSSQFDCQIDCYGPDSGDLAELISMLFREQYAVEKFAATGLELAPLYASDARQMPIVTGEEQYVERWTFDLSLQFNPMVSTVQQSANMLDVGIISVDAAYPPQP